MCKCKKCVTFEPVFLEGKCKNFGFCVSEGDKKLVDGESKKSCIKYNEKLIVK